jgi:hypothetical protein
MVKLKKITYLDYAMAMIRGNSPLILRLILPVDFERKQHFVAKDT